MSPEKAHKTYLSIVNETRKYFHEQGFKKAVLGLSGGLDSSLCAFIAADALGAKNVTALIMPYKKVSSKKSRELALMVAKGPGLKYFEQPVDSAIKSLSKAKWKQTKNAKANLAPRIRMILLYSYANSKKALVVGSANKSELITGYGTKHGDLAADIFPLGDLLKSEVKGIARWRGIPEKIVSRAPTAELFRGQTDKKELGADYEELDPILKAIEKGFSRKKPKKRFNNKLAEKILKRAKENRHKAFGPKIIRVKMTSSPP